MQTTLKGDCIMEKDIENCIVLSMQFSEEELEEIKNARNMPITYDEDCPETTPEMAKRFHRVNPVRKTVYS